MGPTKSVSIYYKCASNKLQRYLANINAAKRSRIYRIIQLFTYLVTNMAESIAQHYLDILATAPVDNESLAFFSGHPCGLPYLADSSPEQTWNSYYIMAIYTKGAIDKPSVQESIIYDEPGTLSTRVVEHSVPEPGSGEVLIRLYGHALLPDLQHSSNI